MATTPRSGRGEPPLKPRTIGDVFYETRQARGQRRSLRRFTAEALDGRVEPVMLSYIEKGERFPSEDLVRQLAAVRGEDPQPLLAILWRDRMARAITRELDRAFLVEAPPGEVEDGALAVRTARAMAALPDDGKWIAESRWRRELRRDGKRRQRSGEEEAALDVGAVEALLHHGLIEIREGWVRRLGRHLQAEGREERRAVAQQFAGLFAKGLIDRVALPEAPTGSHLRNHYLNIERARIAEFQAAVDAALQALVERFAQTASKDTEFMNVLATVTPS